MRFALFLMHIRSSVSVDQTQSRNRVDKEISETVSPPIEDALPLWADPSDKFGIQDFSVAIGRDMSSNVAKIDFTVQRQLSIPVSFLSLEFLHAFDIGPIGSYDVCSILAPIMPRVMSLYAPVSQAVLAASSGLPYAYEAIQVSTEQTGVMTNYRLTDGEVHMITCQSTAGIARVHFPHFIPSLPQYTLKPSRQEYASVS
jgi:hypothetical protein